MAESLPALREEIKEALCSLNEGKSPGVDTIPSELLKTGGKATTTVLTATCQKTWEMKKWLKEWTESLIIPLSKKGNLRQSQNYRTNKPNKPSQQDHSVSYPKLTQGQG